MGFFNMLIIAMLTAFAFYNMDMTNRMRNDIKFIKNNIEKKPNV